VLKPLWANIHRNLAYAATHYGPVEKMAFFDASGLYALNPQQEALNCIIFIFSDL